MFHHDEPGWGWEDVRNADGTYQSYGEYYGQPKPAPEYISSGVQTWSHI